MASADSYTWGVGYEEEDGCGPFKKGFDLWASDAHLLEGTVEVGAYGRHIGRAGNRNLDAAEDAFFQSFAPSGEGVEC